MFAASELVIAGAAAWRASSGCKLWGLTSLSSAVPHSCILSAKKGQSPPKMNAHVWTSLIHEQIKLCFFSISRC